MKQLLLFTCLGFSLFFSKTSFGQNTNPIAINDYVTVCENSGEITVDVQNNDTDPEFNALTTTIYFGPMNGTAFVVSGDQIAYTPSSNFNGNDTIIYIVCDNGSPSLCDTALLVITVQPAPIADAESDETICLNDSVQIGTPGALGVTYLWSPAAGLSSTMVPQPYASPTTTTTYYLLATNTLNGCQSRDTMILTVNPLPLANAGPDHTSCEGDSVLLGTPGTAGNTYYWSPIPPLDWNSIPQPMAAPSTTTTFTLTVTTTLTGCQSKDSVLVTINPSPVTEAGPDQTICNGDSVQIGTPGSAGNTYTWTPATGLSAANVAQPMASPSTTTTYTLVVTTTATGCFDTSAVTVTVAPGIVANAGPDRSSCSGNPVQIGTPAVAGNTYVWTPATGLSSTTVAQPMANPVVTTTYTLTVTNTASGCVSTDAVTVTVGTTPIASAGPDQQICSGGSVQIGTPGLPGNTYSWSPVTGLSASNVAQPTASPVITTTYVLTVTQTASGCQNTDAVIVTVNQAPVANAGPNRVSCDGDSVRIGAPAIAGNTYSWSPATGLSSSTVAQPMAAPLVTTSYTLTVTNTATGCTSTDVVVVTVSNAPIASAGPDMTICSNDSTIIGTPGLPGNTYSWSPVNGLSHPNAAVTAASPAITTTYTLTVTGAAGCQTIDSVIVNVNPVPVADAGPDQVSCSGDSVQIGTPGLAGNTYVWLPVLGLSSPFVAQPMAAPLVTTTYTVTVTNTATGCTNTDIVVVSLGTTPAVNAGADQTICNGDSVQIGTAPTAGLTYTWSPATGLSSTTVAQPIASPSATTSYTLTVSNASGCSNTDSVIVTVNPLPVADAGADQSTCASANVQIGTPAVAGYSYSWSPATGLSSTTVAQPTANPTATTTYTLTVTNTATGCSNEDSVVVTVTQPPVANAGADTTICAGNSVTIGSPAVSGNTYSWSPATGLSSSTVAQPTANPASTTTYTVTVTNTASGCTSTDIIVVTVDPSPTANAGADVSTCNGDSVMIGATPASGVTYSWSPATGLSSTTVAQPIASPSVTTTYTLTVTNSNGCFSTNEVVVTVNTPYAEAGESQSSCSGSTVILGTPAITGYTYLWTPSTGLNDPTIAQPTAAPDVTTTYTLMVTDTATGCSATDIVIFKVEGGDVFNAFSPNGDGMNDWWNVPLLDCYDENQVIIVNRWGSEVWRADNYDNVNVRWNGQNLNGTDVTDGTYYYIIKYNNTEKRGWVFIKR